MKISIKTREGECFEIETCYNDTIENIKSKISSINSIPNDKQHLFYDCTTLKDGKRLNDYSIQSGSEIIVIHKNNALLLQSSKIFDKSSLIDHIRQSLIDLQSTHPTQNVIDLLIESISYLDEELDIVTAKELFSLILSCFSQYPEESFKIFQIKFQKPNISSLHIILLTLILSQIPNSSFDDFLSSSITEVIPQINKNQGNLNVNGYEIKPEFQAMFIINLILSIKLTEQIVTLFYQYIFSKGDFGQINSFIEKVHANDMLKLIPESCFLENKLFMHLSSENIKIFLTIVSEKNLKKNLPFLLNYPNIEKMANLIINKCIEFNIPPLSVGGLFSYYTEYKYDPIWNYLTKNNIVLLDPVINKIKKNIKLGIDYFAKTPLVMKSFQEPEKLPQDIISYSLLNANNGEFYENVLSSKNIECDSFKTIEFWEHIFSFKNAYYYNKTIDNIAYYFQKYIKENDMYGIFDQLIFNHFPPNEYKSKNLVHLLEKLPESYGKEYHSHDADLINKLIQKTEIPSPSCLQLFDLHLLPIIKPGSTVKPRLLYLNAFSKLETSNINDIEIMKMTHEANDNLLKFIKKNDYDSITNIDDEYLSIIACSLFYSKIANTSILQINGLNCENVLPFLAISLHNLLLDSNLNLDCISNELLIEACKYLEENPTPLHISSIDSILNNAYSLLKSEDTKTKKIYTFLNMVFDLQIKGSYKADSIVLIKAVCRLTNEKYFTGTFFLHNELLKIIVDNIPKILNSWFSKLNLKAFDPFHVNKVFTEFIQNTTSYKPIIDTLFFINEHCLNQPIFTFSDYSNVITTFQKAVYDENWKDANQILKFSKFSNLKKIDNINFYGKKIPDNIFLEYNNDGIVQLLSDFKNSYSFGYILYNFIQGLLKNKSICIKYITVLLEKLTNHQIIPIKEIFDELYFFYQNHELNLIEAIKYSYNFSDVKQKFIKKICTKPLAISSDFNFDYLSIFIQRNTFQSFIILEYIALYFPFLFEPDGSDEKNSLVAVNIVLPALNCVSNMFDLEDTDDNQKKVKKAFVALSFLHKCLYSVKFLSTFILWFFENITKLNESQVFCLSHILISLFQTDKINKIIVAYAIKYNFIEIITNLLSRKISEGFFKSYYNQNLYELLNLFYKLLSNVQSEGDSYFIDQICSEKIKNPFENQFNNCITIYPIKIKELSFTFHHITNFLSDIFSFIEDINTKDPLSFFDELIKDEKQKQINISDFSKLFENDIPNFTNNKIESVSPKITYEMHNYLLSCPSWALNFFEHRYSYSSMQFLEQIPEYNEYFASTLKKLKEFDSSKISYSKKINQYDRFSSKINSQTFFQVFVQEASNDIETNKDLTDTIRLVGVFSKKFIEYIIQYMSEYISKDQIKPQTLNGLCQILNTICYKEEEIENDFLQKCGNKLIDIALSDICKYDENLLKNITSNLCLIKGKLPIRIIHVIGLIFGYHPNLTNNAVGLYFKIGDVDISNIMPIIQMRFKKDAENENPDFHRIKYYIKNFPTLTKDCLSVTKVILNKVINKYKTDEYTDKELQQMIIEIFNLIAPNRSLSNSINHIIISNNDDKKQNDEFLYSVPDYIKQLDPVFWGEFYENYRIFLNEIIKNDESFIYKLGFLQDYYELISFNKRYLIFRKNLNSIRGSGNSIYVNVSRSRLLLDSFGHWCVYDPKDFISGINVRFKNEKGSDSGGLTREWLTYLVKELMNQENGLFVKNENQTYHLNPAMDLSFLNIECLKMAGAIIAISIIKKTNVHAHLCTALLKQILHQEITINDMKDCDESLFNSFQSILKSEDIKSLNLVFSIDELQNGELTQINLIENGDKIEVTNENKSEYVRLYTYYKLKDSVSKQIKAFCEGFESVIEYKHIKMLSPKELDMIICGKDTIDIENMKKYTKYEGKYDENHPVISMFYNVISKWNQEDLSKLLQFITGASCVGVNGFDQKDGNYITITSGSSKDHFPISHTCYKQIVLPEYENEKDMNDKLLLAIQDCYFGFS